MKQSDLVKQKQSDFAGTLKSIDGNIAKIETPKGSEFIDLEKLELVTIVFEVFSIVKDLFATKLPLEIKVGDRNYCLNLRYDHYEKVVFAYYKDEMVNETLIGTAHGKNTNRVKKQLKKKLKQAGYL